MMSAAALDFVDAAAFAIVWYIMVMMRACNVLTTVSPLVIVDAVVEAIVRIEKVLGGNRHVV